MEWEGEKTEKKRTIPGTAYAAWAAAALLLAILLGWGIYSQAQGRAYTLTTYAMGTYVQQTVYGKNREEAARKASAAVTELENKLSWRVEGSELSLLNRSAGGGAVSLSPETWDVLNTCILVSEKSGGAFDPTIAPVSRLWDFDGDPHVPEENFFEEALTKVGYSALSLGEGTAALSSAGTSLDLGAVGKGAACEKMVELYAASGVDRGVAAVGGSVGVYGEKPGGEPWRVAVRDPDSSGSLGEISLFSGFVSTSGSYEKTFTAQGKSYHHLLDPKTGYPAESGLLSVTVWSGGGAMSDALSTACFVLGYEKSLPLLEELDAQGVFVTTDHKVYVTSGLGESFSLTGEGYVLAARF